MTTTMLNVAVSLLALNLISLWWVFYQLIKQQGRLLLRLDRVEAQLLDPDRRVRPRPQPKGLDPGEALPSFRLPGSDSREYGREDFKGKSLLLINWHPGCGYCAGIAPELAKLQDLLKKQNTEMVFLAGGSLDANLAFSKKHGLKGTILLANQETKLFKNFGTPVAYLVDAEGKVAKPLAIGAQQVPVLAREAAGVGGQEHRDTRPSLLQAGSRAPQFRLRDLANQIISSSDFLGKRLLLVLSDPDCQACEVVAGRLARLQHRLAGENLALLWVSRGQSGPNRQKAEHYGFSFPVALQQDRELSEAFGTTATPVAFLIGPDGMILENAALGHVRIKHLLNRILKQRKITGLPATSGKVLPQSEMGGAG